MASLHARILWPLGRFYFLHGMKIGVVQKSVVLPQIYINRADFCALTYFLCQIGPTRPD